MYRFILKLLQFIELLINFFNNHRVLTLFQILIIKILEQKNPIWDYVQIQINSKIQIIVDQHRKIEMESWDQQLKKILADLVVANLELDQAGNANTNGNANINAMSKEEQKKLKKKLKKYTIEKDQTIQSALDKTKKLLDQIYKNYEVAAKQYLKTNSLKNTVNASKADRDNSINQVKITDGLHKQFRKKYDEVLKQAQQVEKQEQKKRKSLIQQLQNRIKTVQDDYEKSGKQKIQKYKENQILKHELLKIEPQAVTTQSLFDAQLKKKEVEIEIQMTTLKQKIEMMSNFKKMGAQTKQKLQVAEQINKKIEPRLALLDAKQNENKIVVARAHLILQQYRKSITKINTLLTKSQKQALNAKESVYKKSESMNQVDKSIAVIDHEIETQKNQIKILLSMEESLKKQLAL